VTTATDMVHGGDNPVRYEHDGKVYYRASGLMMCDRMFVALANGFGSMGTPDWMQEVFDEGKRMEGPIIDMYEEQNHVFVERVNPETGEQWEILLEVLDDVFIVGHTDGVEIVDGVLVEAKKFRESTWGKFLRQGVEALPSYPWQVSAYMHGMGLETCHFVGGRYDKNKNTITEVFHHVLQAPPIPLKAIIKRVAHLERLINESVGVEDVKCSEPKQYPCPFYYLHDEDDKFQPPTKVQLSDDMKAGLAEIDTISEELTKLNKLVKELTDRRSVLKDGIHAWMLLNGVDDDEVVEDGGYEFKYHTSFVNGYEVKPGDRLTVTVKKKKADGTAAVKPTKKTAAKKLAPKGGA